MSNGKVGFELIISDFYGVMLQANQLNQPYLEILSKLAKNSRVVCFSNSPTVQLNEYASRPELNMISKMYSATELDLPKTEIRSYEKLAELESVDASKIIFIDDQEPYVEASLAAGCSGIIYGSNAQLERELNSLGVN